MGQVVNNFDDEIKPISQTSEDYLRDEEKDFLIWRTTVVCDHWSSEELLRDQ